MRRGPAGRDLEFRRVRLDSRSGGPQLVSPAPPVVPGDSAIAAAGPPSPGCRRLLRRSRAADADLRRKLVAFAKAGGTLFVPSNWPNPEGPPVRPNHTCSSVASLGKGRLAVCKEDRPDAYDTVRTSRTS